MDDKKPPILNAADVQFRSTEHGEKFAARVGDVGGRIGASKLGYNICVVAPGKRAYPRHNHTVNEEMFFVLQGKGEVILGAERFAIREGDFIASPPGGADTAHQIVNTSDAELKYIALSTKLAPEVVEYPDSKKFGVMAPVPDASGKPQVKRFIVRDQATAKDYWEGED
jgi:uncharacterized cupin superfamily protein